MKEHQITMHEPDGWMQATGGYAKDMTLRDYFAAQVMQGLLTRPKTFEPKADSELAYRTADAMLKARQA